MVKESGVEFRFVRLVQSGAVAQLSFHRPDVLNAFNHDMVVECLRAMDRLDPGTRVLVVRGDGDQAFAAGADIKELQGRTIWSEMEMGPRRELAHRLQKAPFLTVAVVQGYAFGAGFEFALACHLRVLHRDATLALPETRLGFLPGNGGTVRLTRLVGPGRALRMILLGERIDADTAERWGIANWVFDAAEFDREVDGLVKRLVTLSPTATRAAIDSVSHAMDTALEQAIEYEHRWFQICLASPEKAEGVAAFLEKRTPQFEQVSPLPKSSTDSGASS